MAAVFVEVASHRRSDASDLASIVDHKCLREIDIGIHVNQLIQLVHRSVLPQKGSCLSRIA